MALSALYLPLESTTCSHSRFFGSVLSRSATLSSCSTVRSTDSLYFFSVTSTPLRQISYVVQVAVIFFRGRSIATWTLLTPAVRRRPASTSSRIALPPLTYPINQPATVVPTPGGRC